MARALTAMQQLNIKGTVDKGNEVLVYFKPERKWRNWQTR